MQVIEEILFNLWPFKKTLVYYLIDVSLLRTTLINLIVYEFILALILIFKLKYET